MRDGKLEDSRQLLLSHGWVIGNLFDKSKAGDAELESFLKYGSVGSGSPEPHWPAVDEKVAEILRTGKVVF